jgi:yecA family protein
MTVDPKPSTYQLKVTLSRSKPPIWRRFLVPDTMDLESLHHTLQIVMGWGEYHLHEFIHGKQRYGIPDEEFDDSTIDEFDITIGELLKSEGEVLTYLYDFGDGWEHEVLLEKIRPFRPDAELPRCTTGARACPPEDVDGIYGYERMLRILCKPSHPEHEEMLEWLGDDFDPRLFDKDEINAQLLRHSEHEAELELFAALEEELGTLGTEPLSAEETALIDRHFPDEGKVGDGRANYHSLQGFITAIICAPRPTFPADWVSALFDIYGLELTQEEDWSELMIALIKLNNHLADAFDNDAALLPEVYNLDDYTPGTSPMELWCDGFLQGFMLDEDDWFDLDDEDTEEEVGSCAAIISALAMRELEDKSLPPDEFREKMEMTQVFLPKAVITLYEMARSEHYAHLNEPFDNLLDDAFGIETPQPVVSAKIGRNEPCPCGSGKKYKKCCLNKPVTLH